MIDDSEINYRSCINITIIMLLLLCTNFIFAHCVISKRYFKYMKMKIGWKIIHAFFCFYKRFRKGCNQVDYLYSYINAVSVLIESFK